MPYAHKYYPCCFIVKCIQGSHSVLCMGLRFVVILLQFVLFQPPIILSSVEYFNEIVMSSANSISKSSETTDGCIDKWNQKIVRFKCEFCKFQTGSERQLHAHGNTHSVGVSAFTCPQDACYYRTMEIGKLKEHVKRHNPNRTKEIQCPFCPKLFYTKRIMLSHLRTHTNERELQCEICQYRAQSRTFFNIHRKKQHALQPLDIPVSQAELRKCEICGFESWNLTNFRRHLMTHRDEKPFRCSFPGCNFTTKRTDALKMHERGHDPDKALRCEHSGCTFMTGNKWILKCHLETHNTEKKYSCSFPGCQHRSKVLQDMKAHERTVHNPERKRNFQRALCEKAFVTLRDLKAHTRAHTKEKHLRCPLLCSYSSSAKKQLYLHIVRKHEKALAEDPAILQRHKLNVKGGREAKQLICKIPKCDYKCWFRRDLKIHMESVHLALRPFKCSFKGCPRAYKSEKFLKDHKKIHDPSSFKVHKCPLCKYKSYFQPSQVRRHILKVHNGNNPYKCRYCSYVSLSKEDVIKHSESSHSSGLFAQIKTITVVVVIQRIRLLCL